MPRLRSSFLLVVWPTFPIPPTLISGEGGDIDPHLRMSVIFADTGLRQSRILIFSVWKLGTCSKSIERTCLLAGRAPGLSKVGRGVCGRSLDARWTPQWELHWTLSKPIVFFIGRSLDAHWTLIGRYIGRYIGLYKNIHVGDFQ